MPISGLRYYCPTCCTTRSILAKSYFENSNIPIRTLLCLLFLWAARVPVGRIKYLLAISDKTATQWFQYFRDTCSHHLLEIYDGGFRLGNPGHIIQLDESVLTKRKYHVGRLIKEQWIFGIYDTTYKVGVITYVPNRTKETLLPLIQKHVKENSIIWTDRIRRLVELPNGYIHGSVNHSENFIDPDTGVCTNAVEAYWSRVKRFLRQQRVMTATNHLPGYLDEFMWRDFFGGEPPNEISKRILRHLSTWYSFP